jgi:homocysteine S-methyltransferase
MKKIDLLRKRLQNKEIIIKDGGMGTEILRRGQATTLPLWSAEVLLTNPQVVAKIHKDYIDAGAEIITTNTFRTTERSLAKKNIHGRAGELTRLACAMAKQVIEEAELKHAMYIAGSMAPLEDCYSPELTPTDKELEREHFEYARDLKEGGVDFLLAETMITIRELRYALKAARKLDMPVAVSLYCDEKLQLLGGEKLRDVIVEVEKYKPLFIGINCVSRAIAERAVKYLRSLTDLPICVYAQGDGLPNENQGWRFNEDKNLDLYLVSARRWVKDGATIIGGCCGTTPLYISKLTQIFSQ